MKPADGPFFSVIIPTYNRAALLPRAVASVQAQSYPHWELIIVDDGSTDHTRTLAEAYARQDGRVRYVWQENKGRGGVRNTGIAQAQGQYLCFLDDDDYYLPHHLAVMYHTLQAADSPIDLVRTDGYMERGAHRQVLPAMPAHEAIRFVWLYGASTLFFAFKRTLFAQFQFDPSLVYSEDTSLIIRLLSTGVSLAHTAERTVVQVEHGGRCSNTLVYSEIKQMHRDKVRATTCMLHDLQPLLLKVLSKIELQQRLGLDYLYVANKYFRTGYYARARLCWQRACQLGLQYDTARSILASVWRRFFWPAPK